MAWASQVALVVNSLPGKSGDIRDLGWIPGSGRSLEGGQPTPSLRFDCLGNLVSYSL